MTSFVELAVRNMDKGRNRPAQIEQRMQFDRGLRLAERRPRKQRQAQIDGCRIQRIDRTVEFHRQRFVGIESSRDPDQGLSKLAMDTPVSPLVGIGQVAACDFSLDTEVVELCRLRTKTGLDVAQALPVRQLSKRHTQKLVETAETAHVAIASVFDHQSAKRVPGCKLHHLDENELARVHRCLPDKARKSAQIVDTRSSR